MCVIYFDKKIKHGLLCTYSGVPGERASIKFEFLSLVFLLFFSIFPPANAVPQSLHHWEETLEFGNLSS